MVSVLGCGSAGPGSIPGTAAKSCLAKGGLPTRDVICRETTATDSGAPDVEGSPLAQQIWCIYIYLLCSSNYRFTETNYNWEIDRKVYVPYSSK